MHLTNYINIFLLIFLLPVSVIAQNKEDILDLSEYPKKFTLSSQISETSGVVYFNDFLYTFNDSGGKAEIYKLNSKNGEIVQTIKIKNAKNTDWEEIALKGDTLFIGDFGNNLGTRKDLSIYSIILPKNIDSKVLEVDTLNTLRFIFEDQTDFENNGYFKTNYDCEAFVYHKGKLHLFTKQWGNNQTSHYKLDIISSTSIQTAKKIEAFTTECVITGADIYNEELYMTGYTTEGAAYIWKFTDFTNNYFFNGTNKKTLIGLTAAISQIEGIAVTEDKIFITGEEMNYSLFKAKPTLYIVNKSEL